MLYIIFSDTSKKVKKKKKVILSYFCKSQNTEQEENKQ